MTLDPRRIPGSLRSLLPLAARWGQSDDGDRESAVRTASVDDLKQLVEAVAAAPPEFDDWLVGDESSSDTPSDEYLAFSYLMNAYEYAKLILIERAQGRAG